MLDDLTRTPEWLNGCTQLDKVSQPPNAVGTKLRYHYKYGRKHGVMDGSIVVREPDRRLAMSFKDKLMEVSVDFATAPQGVEGATMTHTITINTKGFGKMLGPVVSRHLPEQTIAAMMALKQIVEGG